ncbi:type II toxin-antitoxin system VapC family toxin [Cryobacterium aureum]|uniref:type II toxin-antitoxin system VapC family toxin n=1 Tax=Cryobacterium aureum TaxID=995037 RepID=UPI000CF569E6|nr:type II toxin-antitoxin system VapC family toxin [Cryobacterium aureum]
MRLLLDTHIFLWSVWEPSRLKPEVAAVISDRANGLLISAATPWEIAMKHRAGKLSDAEPIVLAFPEYLDRLGAIELPITSRHAIAAGQLEWAHKDPFDRMLAAQCILEGLTLVTSDEAFRSISGVQTLWA